MRKIISMISILANCALNVIAQNLVIEQQGHFSVGGSVIQHEGVYDNSKFVGWATQVEEGQKASVNHAFVDYQIPVNPHRTPLVYVHGYGGSGVCWEMTPDGRDGFSTLMLRHRWSSYVMDLPGRGRAVAHLQHLQSNHWLMRCSGSTFGVWVFIQSGTRVYSFRKTLRVCRSFSVR